MMESERKDLAEFVKKVLELDDAGRVTATVVIDALHARAKFEERSKHERREEKGSPAQCADVPSSQL